MLKGAYQFVDAVYFYFPFQIDSNAPKDLGKVIGDQELLCSLFNGTFSVTSLPETSFVHVRDIKQRRSDFYIYQLGADNFETSYVGKGSILKVKINTIPDNIGDIIPQGDAATTNDFISKVDLYFRFRLDVSEKGIFTKEEISNDLLQSAFSSIEVTDISVNDFRQLEAKTREALHSGKSPLCFDVIHFFYIGSSAEDISGESNYVDCHALDNSRWAKYYEFSNNANSRLISYHWKTKGQEDGHVERMRLFVKSITPERNQGKIIKYALIVIILGTIGSLLASLIMGFICS